jgi:hypothetical protein
MRVPWPARTRRLRRAVREVYAAEIQHLHNLLPYLTAEHPEWPVKETAADLVKKADDLLRMNDMVKTEHLEDQFRLERDRAWIREVRDRATRISGNGD